jgi:hypothetical protein
MTAVPRVHERVPALHHFLRPHVGVGSRAAVSRCKKTSTTASDKCGRGPLLVHSYCNRFHSVSKRHETANALIEMENYPPVSLFHDFGEGVTGNSKLGSFCPHSNYADCSPKTVERRNSNRFQLKIQVLICFTAL